MLEKHYNHKDIEEKWYKRWEDARLFHSERDPEKKPYTIVIPPPNVTGKLHMGHVLNNTIQDALIRYKKMMGFNACWVPGTDHAGIATQTMVEKHLRAQGIEPDDLSREDFLKRVWSWKEEYGGLIIKQLRKLGAACDWERERFTMDEGLSHAVLTFFKRFYDKGWIYRGKYIVNWCPALQTALSDDEVDRSDEPSHLWHFRYPIVGEDMHLVVATTRPETMLGDTGVAVNPNDERYKHLIGKKVKLPIVGREIPIFADEHVEMDFGTGCVKVTPAHDADDFAMGTAHNLEFIIIMDKQARLNENVPEEFQGLDRNVARKAVVAKMDELGLLEKIEDHTVPVGRCYRSKDIIEPYLSEQWFIKMGPMAERALAAVKDGDIKLYPKRWVNTYNYWLENIRDWCISRQLRWGHRIPVYYCNNCDHQMCELTAPGACEKCGSTDLTQDPDVLDTWASSWLWPLSVFGWPEETEDLKYYYPTDVLVTGPDILFFWVARMIMSGLEFRDEKPFSEVYLNGIVRDLDGRKMSKTLGNSPDPLDIIEEYGADALRFSIIYNTPYGQDTRFANESCDLGKGFATKIWNANRFLQMSFGDVKADPNWADKPQDIVGRWILSRLAQTVKAVEEEMDQYKVAAAASRIYNFFWGDFCDWYVELMKPAIKNADADEQAVLLGRTQFVIDSCLRMLHPFMPFVTEELWQGLGADKDGAFLMQQSWPDVKAEYANTQVDDTVTLLQNLITGVRAARKGYGLPGTAKFVLHLYADEAQQGMIEEVGPMLKKLAGLESYHFLSENSAPAGCTAVSLKGMGAFLDLRGHLDIDAELAKIDKKLAKLNKELKPLEGRLGNEKFTSKAPEAVVAKVKAEVEALQEQIATLAQTRTDLEKMGQN